MEEEEQTLSKQTNATYENTDAQRRTAPKEPLGKFNRKTTGMFKPGLFVRKLTLNSDTICSISLFPFSAHQVPSEKNFTLKGKNVLHSGARSSPFSEGSQNNFDRLASPKSVSMNLE